MCARCCCARNARERRDAKTGRIIIRRGRADARLVCVALIFGFERESEWLVLEFALGGAL